MTGEEAKKRLEVWLKCGECPEDKRCYDSYLHSTCEYTDYCDEVSIGESIKVAISALSAIEDIKTDIKRDSLGDADGDRFIFVDNVMRIIDKHISEVGTSKSLPEGSDKE